MAAGVRKLPKVLKTTRPAGRKPPTPANERRWIDIRLAFPQSLLATRYRYAADLAAAVRSGGRKEDGVKTKGSGSGFVLSPSFRPRQGDRLAAARLGTGQLRRGGLVFVCGQLALAGPGPAVSGKPD
jgi:hypothetical protein